jgi:hypothetical protein
VQSAASVPSPDTNSQQFLDLRHEVQRLMAKPTKEYALQILAAVALHDVKSLDTVLAVAAMLNRLSDAGVPEHRSGQLTNLVCNNTGTRDERDAALHDVCRLVSLCGRGPGGVIAPENFLNVLERGCTLARTAELPPASRNGFIEILGVLGAHQGHFRGVQVIANFFRNAPPALQTELLVTVLKGALHVGDTAKVTIQAFEKSISILENNETAQGVLRAAVASQVKQGASVQALLQSFADVIGSYPAAGRLGALRDYACLIEKLRPYSAPLHHVRRKHVDQLAQTAPTTYSLRFAEHMKGVERVLEIARSKSCYTEESLRTLHAVLAPNQSRDLVGLYREFFSTFAQHCESPQTVLRALTRVTISLIDRPTSCLSVTTVLARTAREGLLCDDLVQVMLEVMRNSDRGVHPRTLLQDWLVVAERLSEYVPNLATFSREALEWFLKDPSKQRFADLVALLDCADQLLQCYPEHYQPTAVTNELLQPNGPGTLLIDALRAHERNGYGVDFLLAQYPMLHATLSPVGRAVLRKALDYQIERGWRVGSIFNNFTQIAAYAERSNSDEIWSIASELIDTLRASDVPLSYMGITCLEEYSTDPDRDTALSRIEQHLTAMHRIASAQDLQFEEPATEVFMLKLAKCGVCSDASQVVEMLTSTDDGYGESVDLPQLAEMLGSNLGDISSDAWKAIGWSIESYRAAGVPFGRLVTKIIQIDRDIKSTGAKALGIWRSAHDVMLDLRDSQLPFDLLTGKLLERFHSSGHDRQALYVHFVRGISRFSEHLLRLGEADPREQLRNTLDSITSQNYGLTDNPAMVHKLNLMLSQGGIRTLEEFTRKLRDLKMHALTDIMRNASDEGRKKWARDLMAREFNMGGPPYQEGSRGAREHFNETMEVVDRAFRDSKGFGGLALDSRGVPRSANVEAVPPMLIRFGLDSASHTFVINSSDNEGFPGKGCMIYGIKAEKVFSSDPHWQQHQKSSPYWRWTEGNGLFANQYFHQFRMEYFEKCAFVFMRGLKIVVPPKHQAFVLDKEPYSYLVYNRHFYPGPEVALLIPTRVVGDLLGNALIKAEDYRGFDRNVVDVSKIDFGVQNLLRECRKRDLNLLDLTYGSVIGGGLCNAYAPHSSPHFTWEGAADSYGWSDSWGHVHKFRLSAHSLKGSNFVESLAHFRALHGSVREVVRPLQDYLSAFGFALSFYKMGSTLIADEDFREVSRDSQDTREDDNDGESPQDGELSFEEQQERDNPPIHEYRYRMLQEAYRWHLGAREQGWPRGKIPILHFAWVLDPNSLPSEAHRRFEIDLASMVLKTPDGSFQLPKDSDGSGPEERELWRKHVVPCFENNSEGWVPCMLLRDGAFQIHE